MLFTDGVLAEFLLLLNRFTPSHAEFTLRKAFILVNIRSSARAAYQRSLAGFKSQQNLSKERVLIISLSNRQ